MTTMTVPAARDQLDAVQRFVDDILAQVPHSPETQMQIQIAVEELFVNIASYAYAPESGQAVIACQAETAPPSLTVQFRDWGKPFDPLAKKDADITLSAEERGIGGLGIYMVKDYMDEMSYVYEDGQNVLTIKKNL
jgi:anti-sigma regulatory factor (Ser/Thr protein kinase)